MGISPPISIHTTAKVVTLLSPLDMADTLYFNPHHREGGDWTKRNWKGTSLYFNPHHREGGDDIIQVTPSIWLVISIHTTAKVVTCHIRYIWIWKRNFNPHHREGGDSLLETSNNIYCHFNPHHREGGDDVRNPNEPLMINFNPHHREGGDEGIG